jgi:hypothetical protein
MVIVGGAGLLLALANHVGTWTKGLRLRLSPGTVVFAFLPVLVIGGWVLIASQPGTGWQEARIDSWSNTMGILGLVHSVSLWRGVLAFAFGLMLGSSLDGVPEPAAEAEPAPAYAGPRGMPAHPAADEPVAAERRWTGRRGSNTLPRTLPRRAGHARGSQRADPDRGSTRSVVAAENHSVAAADPCREGSR